MVRFFAFLLCMFVFGGLTATTANAGNGKEEQGTEIEIRLPPVAGTSPETGFPADGSARVLAPRSALWFQFTYGGNRTPIEIRLMDGRAPDIHFGVYTPELIERRRRGESTHPIGQMRRASGAPPVELLWSGKFSHGGVYFVVVNNFSDLAITIGLLAQGSAVRLDRAIQDTIDSSNSDAQDGGSPPGAPVTTLLNQPDFPPLPSPLATNAIPVVLPGYIGVSSFSIPLTARPLVCTASNAMPANVTRSILLCPNQTYAPFRVTGSNLTVYGDATAVIQGAPRGFGITVTGNNVAIVGVRVAANTHPSDLNKWLCLHETCSYDTIYQKETVQGGAGYGGGVLLLNNSNSSVSNSSIWGGTIGVASVRGRNNKIFNNNLSNLNGWGAYLMYTEGNYVVNNTFNDVNRGCTGPDGFFYQSGCESSGFACAGCQQSVIVSNTCARAANCYYADGLGGAASNDNKFFNNRCAAAGNNCFEITFSQGNQFDYNVATFDVATGQQCNYPFWIAGSVVYFGKHNDWACTRQRKRAEEDSKNSTNQHTEIRGW